LASSFRSMIGSSDRTAASLEPSQVERD